VSRLTNRAGASLGQKTVAGFLYLTGAAIVTRLAIAPGQIVLAWILAPEDFGRVGLALTFSTTAGVLQQTGLHEMLIQRQARFHLWASAACGLSIALGLIAGILIAAAAPVAASLCESPQLARLMLVLALAAPLRALSVVPLTQLHIQLRFRAVALATLAESLGAIVLSVFFALLGLGAYSLVLPQPIIAAFLAVYLWQTAGAKVRWRPETRRWRHMWGDSSLVIGTSLLWTSILQSDYLILGLLHPTAVVGIYYFAFNLATQTGVLLAYNYRRALFPVMGQLQSEPMRQTQAFFRATRLLSLITVPVCLLQAILAAPIIRLLFAEKWWPAIPVFQILSIGMVPLAAIHPAYAIMQAQRRFAFLFRWSFLSALAFVALVTPGAWFGGATGVAVAVAAFYVLMGPPTLYLAGRSGGGTWVEVWHIYYAPVCGAVSGSLIMVLVSPVVASQFQSGSMHKIVLAGVGLSVYLLVAWCIAPEDVRQLLLHLHLPTERTRTGVESR
jgi:O-antigen/teichoic acid export membrane protein